MDYIFNPMILRYIACDECENRATFLSDPYAHTPLKTPAVVAYCQKHSMLAALDGISLLEVDGWRIHNDNRVTVVLKNGKSLTVWGLRVLERK